jgi:hypothetical protein
LVLSYFAFWPLNWCVLVSISLLFQVAIPYTGCLPPAYLCWPIEVFCYFLICCSLLSFPSCLF